MRGEPRDPPTALVARGDGREAGGNGSVLWALRGDDFLELVVFLEDDTVFTGDVGGSFTAPLDFVDLPASEAEAAPAFPTGLTCPLPDDPTSAFFVSALLSSVDGLSLLSGLVAGLLSVVVTAAVDLEVFAGADVSGFVPVELVVGADPLVFESVVAAAGLGLVTSLSFASVPLDAFTSAAALVSALDSLLAAGFAAATGFAASGAASAGFASSGLAAAVDFAASGWAAASGFSAASGAGFAATPFVLPAVFEGSGAVADALGLADVVEAISCGCLADAGENGRATLTAS